MAGLAHRAEFAAAPRPNSASAPRRENPPRGGCARWCAHRDAWPATPAAPAVAGPAAPSPPADRDRPAAPGRRPMPFPARTASHKTIWLSALKRKLLRVTGMPNWVKPLMISSLRSKPIRSWPTRSAGLERAAAPVEIGSGRAGAERDVADLARHQLVLRRLDHADGDVGIAAQQVLDLVRGDDLDLDAGLLDAEPRRHLRQHIGRHHLAGGNAHRAFDRLDRAQRQQRKGARLLADRLAALEQRAAGFRQRIAAPPAPEQRDAERLLELADVAAERRLACRQLSRGGRQAAGFRHGDEALDQVPVDVCSFIYEYQIANRSQFPFVCEGDHIRAANIEHGDEK